MTNQEAFDLVLDGIRGQGYQRATMRGNDGKAYCCYFADNGNRCAIGHLLPEDTKEWVTNDMPYEEILEKLKRPLDMVSHALLDYLMMGHDDRLDSSQPKADFEKYMIYLAQRYELKYTEPAE